MKLGQRSDTVPRSILKAKVTRHAVWGVLVAMSAVVIATIFSVYIPHGELTFNGIIQAQRENVALWLLDAMPFFFAYWGQYVGTDVAHNADAIVINQTRVLREYAQALESQATRDALHDSLTGLPARAHIRHQIAQSIHSWQPGCGRLVLLLVSLDGLAETNGAFGHAGSEQLLIEAARRLSRLAPHGAVLARSGEDEFAIALRHKGDIKAVEKLSVKILEDLGRPITVEEMALEIPVSIGVSLFPDHADDADRLFRLAAIARSSAQRESLRFKLYLPGLDIQGADRLALKGDLRRAMSNNELDVYYQPKVRSTDVRVTEVEALVRWNHPQRGFLAPDIFIPLAEASGLHHGITQFVLDKALAHVAEWNRMHVRLSVAVNLSARDLSDDGLPGMIHGLLDKHGVKPSGLKLEITETSVMEDQEHSRVLLDRLSGMGLQISVDDFGTGYSSLFYLKKFPINEIKIDKSFVQDMMVNDNDREIVQAAIELAHNLGLSVVAEGVESKAAMTTLQYLGCDSLQGFYISPPLSARDLLDWLPVWDKQRPKSLLVTTMNQPLLRTSAQRHPLPGRDNA